MRETIVNADQIQNWHHSHGNVIRLATSWKKGVLGQTTSWHTARFFCVFYWDLLKEAKFHLFTSWEVSSRACLAQNKAPAQLDPHQVS